MILINLLPQELRRKETPKIVLPELPIKKTLTVIGLSLLGLQLLLTLVALCLVWREAAVKHGIERLSGELRETIVIKSQTVTAMNKLKDIRNLVDKKFYWTALLNGLSESMTRGVWLRSLSLDEVVEEAPRRGAPVAKAAPVSKAGFVKKSANKSPPVRVLRLEGSVAASGQETAFIGRYVKALKDNAAFAGLFRDVELSNINQRKIKEYDVYDFVLLCKFKKERI